MSDVPTRREVNELLAATAAELQKKLDNTIVLDESDNKPSANDVNVFLEVKSSKGTIDTEETIDASTIRVDTDTTLDQKLKELGIGVEVSRAKPDHHCLWFEILREEHNM